MKVRRGFTVVEVLVVITIIVVVTGIIFSQVHAIRREHKETQQGAIETRFPGETTTATDGIYIFRVKDGVVERIAGPLKEK